MCWVFHLCKTWDYFWRNIDNKSRLLISVKIKTSFRGNINFSRLCCRFFWHLQSLPARGAKVLSTLTVLTILTILLSFLLIIVMYLFYQRHIIYLGHRLNIYLDHRLIIRLKHRHIIHHSRFRLFFVPIIFITILSLSPKGSMRAMFNVYVEEENVSLKT